MPKYGLTSACLLAFLLTWPGYALANTCWNAANQLTQYIAQVNQVANWEQSQGIRMRCFGNTMCMQGGLNQLQYWYAQQSNFVNMTYMQLVQACSTPITPPPPPPPPPPPRKKMENIVIGLNDIAKNGQNKNTTVTIPLTPEGFKP